MSYVADNIIFQQLGGSRFAAMIGSKNYVGDDTLLRFDLDRGLAKNKIIKVEIKLTEGDEYTVTFFRKAKRDPVLKISIGVEVVEKVECVQVGALQEVFTRHTGLDTHL